VKRRAFSSLCGVALFAALGFTNSAISQTYPDKPIKLIVPFPPGGGTDIVGRVLADQLAKQTGWKVVVENKPGAGGTIGLDAAAKSKADGYTIVLGQNSNMAIAPSLMSALPYDPIKDFTPITLVTASPLAITVGANSPFKTLADLVAAAKKNPGSLLFASPGNATVAHLTGEYFKKVAGVSYKHVPYKGTSQALPDVISGRASFYIASLESSKGPVKSGQLRPLAVTSSKRHPLWPDVPTVSESGFPDFQAGTWWGVAVPADTPNQVVARLDSEFEKVLKTPAVVERLGSLVPLGQGPFSRELAADRKKWAGVIEAAGIKKN
jgi:tripartite-type tricarboxylate transporter receptor subunit TctC